MINHTIHTTWIAPPKIHLQKNTFSPCRQFRKDFWKEHTTTTSTTSTTTRTVMMTSNGHTNSSPRQSTS